MMLLAERSETSCSPLRPPYTTATFLIGFPFLKMPAGHPGADAGQDLVRIRPGPPRPIGGGRFALLARLVRHARLRFALLPAAHSRFGLP